MAPARAFIVRPFGCKAGIDFTRVDEELIQPVLEQLGIVGETTEAIARAGNIRADMFERLVAAELVIADISIHNANVYYELGVRHALRPRTTILMRAPVHDVPFDLRTDRYFEYDPACPAGARELLANAIESSRRAGTTDSPVFTMLPALAPPDLETLHPVPEGFSEDVRSARRHGDRPMLAVLAEEAQSFEWRIAGARLVAKEQFALSAWADARATLEGIRDALPDDPMANELLGTVYQRLGQLVESTAAIDRLLACCDRLERHKESEALALRARNDKDRWCAEWETAAPAQRTAVALRSGLLELARSGYGDAFSADQNNYYPGLNALCLTTIALCLGEREPSVWAGRFGTRTEAKRAGRRLELERAELAVMVRRSIEAARLAVQRRRDEPDPWVGLSAADLLFLTTTKPERIAAAYADALAVVAAGQGDAPFAVESAAKQLRLFASLDIFTEAAIAGLEALGASAQAPPHSPSTRTHLIVFSGHRLDAPDRVQPRFPPESLDIATAMIRDAIAAEVALADGEPIEGIAGGASGGDIIFHELCAAEGIPTTLLLAIPPDDYAAASVNDAGPAWTQRFRALTRRPDVTVKVLSQRTELPAWLRTRADYSIWERNNRWTLHTAVSRSEADVSLIVLWDGAGGDGPGGTADMVNIARSRGVRVIPLDAKRLLHR